MNMTELIQRTRDILGDDPQQASAPKKWSDALIARNLSAANDAMWMQAVEADEHWGFDVYSLSSLGAVASTAQNGLIGVYLPRDMGIVKFISEQPTDLNRGLEVAARNFSELEDFIPGVRWPVTDQRSWFPGPNQQALYFTNTAAIDTSKLLVWFLRKPPPFLRFSASAYPTTSAITVNFLTGATIGKVGVQSDYYRNSIFECLTTSGSVTPQGLRFVVSGWALGTHPNFRMDLDTPHGLASGATTWETVPIWPEEHHDLLATIAAYKCLLKGSDVQQRAAIAADMQAQSHEFVQRIENRQVQWPRYVHYLDD